MEIWVHRNGQYAGKFSASVIREKIADGSLSAGDLAWDQEKSLWKPLGEFLATLSPARVKSDPIPLAVPEAKAETSLPATESSPTPAEPKPAEVRRVTPPPLPWMPAAASQELRPPTGPTPTVAYEP